MNSRRYVEKVVDEGLCCGCGTCMGVCPVNAIDLKVNKNQIYVPLIDPKKCTDCNLCMKCCPGHHFNFDEYNKNVFRREPDNSWLGNYSACYLAYSRDEDIRYKAASGGVLTSLLVYAQDKGLIDGVIVTKMNENNPLEPVTFVAKNKEEIKQSLQSKYCPVAVNYRLKDIIESTDERFAVVGLPCHIQGVRKAEEKIPGLKNKIVYHFGIFCSHTITFNGTKFLLDNLGVKEGDIRQITYRGDGWPGSLTIAKKDGQKVKIPNQSLLWNSIFNSFFFVPKRCLLCSDLSGEMADISFGDPWLKEIIETEKRGMNIIVTRTEGGEQLLREAHRHGYIDLSPIEADKVVSSQRLFMYFKKINITDRTKFWRLYGKKIPEIRTQVVSRSSSIIEKVVALTSLFNGCFGEKFSRFLKYIPRPLLQKYFLMYSGIMVRCANKFLAKQANKKRINVLVINAHWNNRGDEAAIRAMIDGLKEELPIGSIEIMILSKSVTEFPYDDIKVLSAFPAISNPPSLIKWALNVVLSLLSSGKLVVGSQAKEYVEAVKRADIVIHAPGGPSIGELYTGVFGLNEFSYLYRLLLPILQDKLVYFYAPSMGPFTSKLKNFLRKFILERAGPIVVREELSKEYLEKQLGVKAHVALDAAFQNCVPIDYYKKYDGLTGLKEIVKAVEEEKVVGIVVTDLAWHPKYRDDTVLRDNIRQSISKTLAYLTDHGYKVLLIPQLFGEQNDIKLLTFFSARDKDIFVLPPQIDAYGQQALITKLFAVISMRYHPTIFAAKGNIPAICIYYEHKMKGFVEKLGRTDLLLDVKNISADLIIEKFQYLEQNIGKIKNEIQQKVPKLQEASKITTDILRKQLRTYEEFK